MSAADGTAPDFAPEYPVPNLLEQREAASLAELVDAYAEAKAAEAAAADRAKDLRDQLLEYRQEQMAPDQNDILGRRYALRVVTSKPGHRLDTSRLKREQPAIFAAFSVVTASTTRLTVIDRAQEQA